MARGRGGGGGVNWLPGFPILFTGKLGTSKLMGFWSIALFYGKILVITQNAPVFQMKIIGSVSPSPKKGMVRLLKKGHF